MRLIIVRHGETQANLSGIWQGGTHGLLSKRGKEQVKLLASRLKSEKIDIIYSSDLRRARQTTKAIAKFHKVPLHYVKELREMHMGIHEGKPWSVFSHRSKSNRLRIRLRPKGGENYIDVKKRVNAFTANLYKKYGDKTVLLSTHGNVIRCIACIYLGMSLNDVGNLHPKNAGTMILEVKGAKGRILKDDLFEKATY